MNLKTDWFFPNMEIQSMTRNCHNINIVMPCIAYKIVVKLTCRLFLVHVVVVDSVGRVLDKYLYGLVRTS